MAIRNSIICVFLGTLFITGGTYFQRNEREDGNYLSQEIVGNLHAKIADIESEAAAIIRGKEEAWGNAKHSFFLMDSMQVLRWNRADFFPDVRTVQDEFDLRLLQWPRGIFLLRKIRVNETQFLLGVVPLLNRYKINNRYLVSGWNCDIFPTQDVVVRDPAGEGLAFVWNDKAIIKIQITGLSPQRTGAALDQFWIFTLGLLFILLGISFFVRALHTRGRHQTSFLALLGLLIVGRLIMLSLFQSPNIPLFDPANFASSSYNRSIGDLFINALTVAVPIIYLFFNYHRFSFFRMIFRLQKGTRHMASMGFLVLCFLSILFPFLFIETIFHNSAIPLDISRTLIFSSIRVVSYLSIIVGCTTSFMLVHVFSRIATGLAKNRIIFSIHGLVALLIFVSFSYLIQRDYWISGLVSVFYLLLISLLQLNKYLLRISYITFLYLFVAIITFSILGAFSVRRFVIEDKIASQFRFANSFLIDRDFLGEYLLGEGASRIAADPFIQTRLRSPFLSKTPIRQKVKQVYLNSYFDRYDIQIYLFNSSGESHDNFATLGFKELISNFRQKATQTNYEGVYFLKNSTPESAKQYLVVIPVRRFGMVMGYIVLDLSLKRIIPRNVFPELLLDDRFIQYFKNRDFSYAFYVDGKVNSSFGDYNYEKNFSSTWLSDSSLLSRGLSKKGYIHIAVEDEQGNFTIVSSPDYQRFGVITNFSFFFTIGLNLILLGLLMYGAITLYQGSQLNYSARIQLYIYTAFILPLFLVSITTLGLISRSAETQLKEEYVEKSKLLGERLTPLIDTYFSESNQSSLDLENQLIELAKLANVDASIFLPSGKLLTSSQPLIYEDRILPTLIDRAAYEAIVNENEQAFINNEKIGSLTYNSSYFALRSPESGNLLGILSLPFFESASSLERTQINVVSNIMTIFCVVFILFLVLSFFAVRWLTFPLQFITKTLRKTSLTISNKPLIWNTNDEIGLMVNEYNRMLDNLEQSKIELSRIQKESAWREIAKQVAHEIKNPLTPMKLTLQQLEHAMLADGISKEKIKKSLQTLLQQVEILNDIAASFSAFARMPAPILQRIEITALVQQLINLHADYKEGNIKLEIRDSPIYIMGDEQLLNRVFGNILLNALQSGTSGKMINVQVEVKKVAGYCIISFRDDGLGIDPTLREKVFMPHFSTKKSGSGLGLAIAKQGIEQNGGSIRFETGDGVGTTFYIEIPIIE